MVAESLEMECFLSKVLLARECPGDLSSASSASMLVDLGNFFPAFLLNPIQLFIPFEFLAYSVPLREKLIEELLFVNKECGDFPPYRAGPLGKVSAFFFLPDLLILPLDFPGVTFSSCEGVDLFRTIGLAGRLVIAVPWWKGDSLKLKLAVSSY